MKAAPFLQIPPSMVVKEEMEPSAGMMRPEQCWEGGEAGGMRTQEPYR